MDLHRPLLLLSIIALSYASSPPPPPDNPDIAAAEGDMEAASYYTFVTLMNMAKEWVPTNTTFLMPNDNLLSDAVIAPGDVLNFLSRHSVPCPLRFDVLRQLPTRSELPTNADGMSLTVTNNGADDFRLNNVRIVTRDVCATMNSIACHGIDGIIQDSVSTRNYSTSHPCFAQGPDAAAVAPVPSAGGNSASSAAGGTAANPGYGFVSGRFLSTLAFAGLWAMGLLG